jgi:hypothetical protein
MYHVEPKKQWNMQARFFDRYPLILIDQRSIDNIQQRPNLSLRNHVFVVSPPCAGPGRLPGGVLHQLANFFFQCHAAEKSVNARVNFRISNPGFTRGRNRNWSRCLRQERRTDRYRTKHCKKQRTCLSIP